MQRDWTAYSLVTSVFGKYRNKLIGDKKGMKRVN